MQRASRGMTLLELAVAMMIVLVLSAVATIAWTDFLEAGDAAVVDGAHGSLQTVVAQGSTRQEVNPVNLVGADVVNAAQVSLQGEAGLDGTAAPVYLLTLTDSGRTATFAVQPNGDVRLTGLGGFANYNINPLTFRIQHI